MPTISYKTLTEYLPVMLVPQTGTNGSFKEIQAALETLDGHSECYKKQVEEERNWET